MSVSTAQYIPILKGLQRHISRIDLAMGAYACLVKERHTRENIVAAPVLFHVIVPVLFDHLVLEAAKIYEKKGERSIYKLVNIAQSAYSTIEWQRQDLSLPKIAQQKQLIDSHSVVLTRIKSRRDKVLAHMDKEYFDDPEKINEDFPIEITELIDLLHSAQDIVALHAVSVGIGVKISFGDWIHVFTERMVTTLREHRG